MLRWSNIISHGEKLLVSRRECAVRRHPSASHSIRDSIVRHHAHIATDCGADRARDALKIREERQKREVRAIRIVALLKPSYSPATPSLHPKNRAIHRARVASSRRVSTASRSIIDAERSFFCSRARVFAENVPVRGSALKRHGLKD